jgi:hypothetical protein
MTEFAVLTICVREFSQSQTTLKDAWISKGSIECRTKGKNLFSTFIYIYTTRLHTDLRPPDLLRHLLQPVLHTIMWNEYYQDNNYLL